MTSYPSPPTHAYVPLLMDSLLSATKYVTFDLGTLGDAITFSLFGSEADVHFFTTLGSHPYCHIS